jgi:hypothetical protein
MRLPPEIRNLIYEHVFRSPFAVTMSDQAIEHSLTRTCRKVRAESLTMFFTMTSFNAHLADGPVAPLMRWLQALKSENALAIKQLHLWVSNRQSRVLRQVFLAGLVVPRC